MSRRTLSTLAGSLLCVFIVTGGWFLTRELLNQKEESLLGKIGQVPQQSFEIAFSGKDGAEPFAETGRQDAFVGKELTEEEIAVILRICEAGGTEVLHEPVDGQMNMEQAIAAGQDWITGLARGKALPSELDECSFDKTGAQLCAVVVDAVFMEDLLSFWRVSYEKDDISIELLIHAASGQVWRAVILMNEGRMLVETGEGTDIFKLAFPFMKGGFSAITDVETNTDYSSFEKGLVYGAMHQDALVISGEEPVVRMRLWLCTTPGG